MRKIGSQELGEQERKRLEKITAQFLSLLRAAHPETQRGGCQKRPSRHAQACCLGTSQKHPQHGSGLRKLQGFSGPRLKKRLLGLVDRGSAWDAVKDLLTTQPLCDDYHGTLSHTLLADVLSNRRRCGEHLMPFRSWMVLAGHHHLPPACRASSPRSAATRKADRPVPQGPRHEWVHRRGRLAQSR